MRNFNGLPIIQDSPPIVESPEFKPEELLHSLLEDIRTASAATISDGDNLWGVDSYRYPHVLSPDETFFDLLGGGSFQDVVEARKQNGRSAHVLELFGSGEFLLDPSVADSITGIRLQDSTYDDERSRPRPPHHSVLEGNLFDKEVWDALERHMRANRIPGFDLVVCRPCGAEPWSGARDKYPMDIYAMAFDQVLQRAYDLVSDDNGIFDFEMPELDLRVRQTAAWSGLMRDAGIRTAVRPSAGVAEIRKDPNSPQDLISLSQVL